MIANYRSGFVEIQASLHFRLVFYILSSPSSDLSLINFIGNRTRHHAAAITLYDSPIPAASHEVHGDINHVYPNSECNMSQAISTLSYSNRRQKTDTIIPRRSSPRNSSSPPSPSPHPPRRPPPQQPMPSHRCNQAARRSGFSPPMRFRFQEGL